MACAHAHPRPVTTERATGAANRVRDWHVPNEESLTGGTYRDADRPGRRHGAPTNRTVEPSNPRHLACHHIVWMQHRAYIHRDWRMHAPVGDQFDAVLIIGYRGVAAVQTSECIGLMERSVHGNRDHGQIRVTTVAWQGFVELRGLEALTPTLPGAVSLFPLTGHR